ncbi:hypothetical protein VST7929_00089 [Vibrio stylophorae]|uniref:DNA-protecting protein DprA n=1 Tax=Vibrio stylophorae TaxID=659351 RepID=A0ABM8ZPS0_9VIBR|nr:DNA-processing protein DprA [Vibrio stylophorae]CAH0532277.1 hypothetical protein VST7929_00089 [Vibrio stylophorae]
MADLTAWLTLYTAPRIGAVSFHRLLEKHSPEFWCLQSDDFLAQAGLTQPQIQAIRQPNKALIDACLHWAAQPHCHLLHYDHPLYPALLKETVAAPPLLFVQGDPQILALPQIAIVGSRSASADGRAQAFHFAQGLAEQGIVVTSGLALGVDGQAHRGALAANGLTVAVMGTGLNQIYPARHRSLAAEIIESGALVSEFLPNQAPVAHNFPRRNRVISGLSRGVLVLEAAARSGSLITARYALEQNRDVFAVPGHIHNPLSQGPNQLIKQGAYLVEHVDDIVQQMSNLVVPDLHRNSPAPQAQGGGIICTAKPAELLPFAKLLDTLGDTATPVDQIAERSGLPVHEVMGQLLELELLGAVSMLDGGYILTRSCKS